MINLKGNKSYKVLRRLPHVRHLTQVLVYVPHMVHNSHGKQCEAHPCDQVLHIEAWIFLFHSWDLDWNFKLGVADVRNGEIRKFQLLNEFSQLTAFRFQYILLGS